jgi:hypothetical protein
MARRLIYLLSNESTDSFPDNAPFSFSNVLPAPITLPWEQQLRRRPGLEWHVCLRMIQFNDNFVNTPASLDIAVPHFKLCKFLNWQTAHNAMDEEEEGEAIAWHNASIPTNEFYTPEDMTRALNNLFIINRLSRRSALNFALSTDNHLSITGENVVLLVHRHAADFLHYTDEGYEVNMIDDGEPYTVLLFPPRRRYEDGTSGDLTMITSTRPLRFIQSIPKYIRISMGETVIDRRRAIAVIPYTPSEKGTFHLELRKRQYARLPVSHLSKISAKLLDHAGRELRLAPGQPTILKMSLELRRDEFTRYIASKHCTPTTDTADHNTDFHWHPNPPIELSSGRWKVALAAIYFPKRFDPYPDQERTQMITTKRNNLTAYLRLKKADFINYDAFIRAFSALLETEGFDVKVLNGRCSIGQKPLQPTFVAELELGARLATILGYSAKYIPGKGIILRFKKENNRSVSAQKIDLYRPHSQTIQVWTDMIRPITFGPRRSRVLKVVKAHHLQGEGLQCYTSEQWEFQPLAISHLSNVRFRLLGHDGELIQFDNSKEEVLLNLIFKRMRR